MEPKRVFDTKQTELELDDKADADLIDVLYKLHNPATSASIIQPTTLKNYFPSLREQMAARWKRIRVDPAYRKRMLIMALSSLAGFLLAVFLLVRMINPGPLPLNPERLGSLQDNARVLQRLLENYSVDLGHYPEKLADLAKAGNLRDYNILRTNPLTRSTGSPTSNTWCLDGQPDGTARWIGLVGYGPVSQNGRVIGYRITLGGDEGHPIKINGNVFTIAKNAGPPPESR